MADPPQQVTVKMAGPGPFGFRASEREDGLFYISKLRKRSKADEAGLQESDVLLTINGRSCQGIQYQTAMDLLDHADHELSVLVLRGNVSRSDIDAAFSTLPAVRSSTSHSDKQRVQPNSRNDHDDRLIQPHITADFHSAPPKLDDGFVSGTGARVTAAPPHSDDAVFIERAPTQEITGGYSGSISSQRIQQNQQMTSRSHGRSGDERQAVPGTTSERVPENGSSTSTKFTSSYTVSAPEGVKVNRNADQSLTLMIGMPGSPALDDIINAGIAAKLAEVPSQNSAHVSSSSTQVPVFNVAKAPTTAAAQQGIWRPRVQVSEEIVQHIRVIDEQVEKTTAPLLPKLMLARVMPEAECSSPDTPTRSKKMFADSAFYADPQHKYPTLEEQIKMSRKVAMSVLSPANTNSRGHKMFVKRRERSIRWTHGDKEENVPAADSGDVDEEKFFIADPWKSRAGGVDQQIGATGEATMVKAAADEPITAKAFAPKLPDAQNIKNETLDAMSNEELERVFDQKSTHTNVAPQVCFNLADDLRNMKGKGGRLFAKRQAKSESWVSGDDPTQDPEPSGDPNPRLLEKLAADYKPQTPEAEVSSPTTGGVPVNRLKGMIDPVGKPLMTPWDAVVEYGTVDKAFEHLDRPAQAPPAAGQSKSSTRPQSTPHFPASFSDSLNLALQKKRDAVGREQQSTAGDTNHGRPWDSNSGSSTAVTTSQVGSGDTPAGLGVKFRPVKFSVPTGETSGAGGTGGVAH